VLTYGDEAASRSAAAAALERIGFEPAGDGLVLWPSRVRSSVAVDAVADAPQRDPGLRPPLQSVR